MESLPSPTSPPVWQEFLRQQAQSLGFSQIGVTGIDLTTAEPGLQVWLDAGFHGEMAYMAAHGLKRARPAELIPGTVSIITVRMDYLPRTPANHEPADWQTQEWARLDHPKEAIISVYARGRDYHKVLRARLQKLADTLRVHLQNDDSASDHPVNDLTCRVFTDSAPVLEAELAQRSGQGWRGKHTLVLNRHAGSMFFLGEIYVNRALPHSSGPDGDPSLGAPLAGSDGGCGRCQACITVCPTQAIVAPYQLDARRCISYLTIEHPGPIPVEFRRAIGNRIYGCDDCQLACPWNKFAQRSALPDFDERAGLTGQSLVHLFAWTEAEFLRYTEGSPIRRIGHARWTRNLAVAMGNALCHAEDPQIKAALVAAREGANELVREHIEWALGCSDAPV
jgi:epoxyqueuosine reductase